MIGNVNLETYSMNNIHIRVEFLRCSSSKHFRHNDLTLEILSDINPNRVSSSSLIPFGVENVQELECSFRFGTRYENTIIRESMQSLKQSRLPYVRVQMGQHGIAVWFDWRRRSGSGLGSW